MKTKYSFSEKKDNFVWPQNVHACNVSTVIKNQGTYVIESN